MKFAILMSLLIVSNVFGSTLGESTTDCPMMRDQREALKKSLIQSIKNPKKSKAKAM